MNKEAKIYQIVNVVVAADPNNEGKGKAWEKLLDQMRRVKELQNRMMGVVLIITGTLGLDPKETW